jgi:hypothetical protein
MLYKGLLSCIILAFTSSIDTWSAARVILAIALFSLVATFSSKNDTTERRLVLDIIWNAVEDEYLTVIMYLLCSIPMRVSGKTSQMIHNARTSE